MNIDRSKYVGREVQIFPSDNYAKFGIITNVDDLGWTIEITHSESTHYEVGKEYFFGHARNVTFKFLDEGKDNA